MGAAAAAPHSIRGKAPSDAAIKVLRMFISSPIG
jgi:hypothetical protein